MGEMRGNDVDVSFPPNTKHHIGNPRTHFQNPWPSFNPDSGSLVSILRTRFGFDRNFVPVPDSREELVQIQTPDWGSDAAPSALKATWIGHASWLVEFPTPGTSDECVRQSRGVRILFDPVFAERTSPVTFLGPKRYTPTPCSIADLPEVDLVAISHNHYDHLDIDTIRHLQTRSSRTVFLCPLGLRTWFMDLGINESRVFELDWWNGLDINVRSQGLVRVVCTPAQHTSARSFNDKNNTLWCSWAVGTIKPEAKVDHTSQAKPIEISTYQMPQTLDQAEEKAIFDGLRLFFAGDTGYRTVKEKDPTPEEASRYPVCRAFTTIGSLLGPFDLALVPIGLYSPRSQLSPIHCAPEDSVLVAKDIRAKLTIGMHYGTVRGGISAQYEDVREPPRRFRQACDREGLNWGIDARLCNVGETVVVT